jgi:hypothetical protein
MWRNQLVNRFQLMKSAFAHASSRRSVSFGQASRWKLAHCSMQREVGRTPESLEIFRRRVTLFRSAAERTALTFDVR